MDLYNSIVIPVGALYKWSEALILDQVYAHYSNKNNYDTT